MSDEQTPPMDRREALKVIAAAAASATLADAVAPSMADAQRPVQILRRPAAAKVPVPPKTGPRGTPTDPDLIAPTSPWPRLLSAGELATLAALCDMIIPADDTSPAASTVGVPAYINEYVSAPYDWAERALVRVRGGLTWLDVEGGKRFARTFTKLTLAEKTAICDDICFYPNARAEFKAGSRFFGEIRNLTQSGFYTSNAGMKDLQYIGNVPLARFDAPPAAVLRKLGLA